MRQTPMTNNLVKRTPDYRDYFIDFDPPPIPSRECDWQYAHKDYDGFGDPRCGFAPTYEACIEAIDDLIESEL